MRSWFRANVLQVALAALAGFALLLSPTFSPNMVYAQTTPVASGFQVLTANQCLSVNLAGGYATSNFTLGGSWSGTVTFYGVGADGVTKTSLGTSTGNTSVNESVAAYPQIQTCFTGAITGSVSAWIYATTGSQPGSGGGGGGNVVLTSPIPLPVTVSNSPGVNVVNTPGFVCISGCSGSSAATTPLPIASTGAAPVASAVPALDYPACLVPAGATPSVTAGNTIVLQCGPNGALNVNIPAPTATIPVSLAAIPNPTSTVQVNTPAPCNTTNCSEVVFQATAANLNATVTVANTPGVVCVSGCSGAASMAFPIASAGAAPTSAPPVISQQTCYFPLGAAPTLVAGNIGPVQCDVNGRVITNPQPQSTLQVNTPPPIPTTPLPTATAGLPPAASAIPVLAYGACVRPAGNTPAITAGNSGTMRCTSTSKLETATLICNSSTLDVESCVPLTAQPSASAGAAPQTTTFPVTAYGACSYNTGAIAVTNTNSITEQCDVNGNLKVNVQVQATPQPAPSAYATVIATTGPVAFSAASRTVLSGFYTNSNALTVYCNLWNVAAASVVLGTTQALVSNLAVPPGQSVPFFTPPTQGVFFNTALSGLCTGNFGASGTSGVSSGTTSVSIFSF